MLIMMPNRIGCLFILTSRLSLPTKDIFMKPEPEKRRGWKELITPGLPFMMTYYITVTAYDDNADGVSDQIEGYESWYAKEVVPVLPFGFITGTVTDSSTTSPIVGAIVSVEGTALSDSTDALIILSYDVGISVPFPVGQPGCPSNVTPCPGCNP